MLLEHMNNSNLSISAFYSPVHNLSIMAIHTYIILIAGLCFSLCIVEHFKWIIVICKKDVISYRVWSVKIIHCVTCDIPACLRCHIPWCMK